MGRLLPGPRDRRPALVLGIVMAGGKGTRLRPLTLDRPKPLLPVAGRPVVAWGLASLARAGIRDVVLTTAYRRDLLMGTLGDGSDHGVRLEYVEEETPLGTAGGVKNARHLIDERFVVMSADVVADIDLEALVAFHERSGALATIALTEVDDPSQFGIVGVDADGRVERFKEKPKREEAFSNLTNTGIYVVEPEVLDRVPEGRPYDWSKDVWTHMVGEPLFGAAVTGYWRDVGRPSDLIAANREMAERVGRTRFGDVHVSGDAEVEGSVFMDGARVAAGARIADSLLLPGARVEARATVRGSVVGERGVVGERAVLERCVIGTGIAVPAGAQWRDRREPGPADA